MNMTEKLMKKLAKLQEDAAMLTRISYGLPVKSKNLHWVKVKLESTWDEIDALLTHLKDEDLTRTVTTLKKNRYFKCPEKFLKLGQRVKAKVSIAEERNDMQYDIFHARPDELGTVIHVEKGFWPTVKFDRTSTSTCVTPLEVEPVKE